MHVLVHGLSAKRERAVNHMPVVGMVFVVVQMLGSVGVTMKMRMPEVAVPAFTQFKLR